MKKPTKPARSGTRLVPASTTFPVAGIGTSADGLPGQRDRKATAIATTERVIGGKAV